MGEKNMSGYMYICVCSFLNVHAIPLGRGNTSGDRGTKVGRTSFTIFLCLCNFKLCKYISYSKKSIKLKL